MSILTLQQDVALLYYAALGKHADESALFYFAKQLSNGHYNTSQLVSALINSADGAKRYDGLSTEQKVQYIYQNITGAQPDSATLDSLVKQQLAGKTLGTLTNQIIDSVKSADGEHTHQQHIQEVVNNTLYPSSLVEDGQIAAASDVQGIYYLLGSMTNARAVDYWGNQLASGQKSAVEIANLFVAERSYINQLSNEDFVKTLYANAFGTAISDGDLQKYLGGLDDGTQTHGDVIMQMMADIRNDTDHDAAKENFAAATHVYAPGETPDAKYVETVMSLYLAVAGSGTNATALDTFSRLLASGTSTQDLLKTLANSQQFSGAGDYQKIYSKLYSSEMSSSVAQALMLKTGNDKIAASALIIDALRNGEYPLGGTHWTLDGRLYSFNRQLADLLGYQKNFNSVFTLSDDGKLMAETNNYGNHTLSSVELLALSSGMKAVSINVDKSVAITLDAALENVTHVVLSGKYAASAFVISSLRGRYVELSLDSDTLSHIDASSTPYYDKVSVDNGTDLTHATLNLITGEGGLLWQGNSVDGGANHVSETFTAKGGYNISANFITKSVYLTTDENGERHGQIVSNIDQFANYSIIDLTHYVGTGEIYLDGKLVATEGRNVFDFGLLDKNATIFNPDYANASSLEQDPHTTGWHNFKFSNGGAMLSAYSGDLTLLNVNKNRFSIDGELTNDSHVTINTSAKVGNSFSLGFTEKAWLIRTLDAGSFSFNSKTLKTLTIDMLSFNHTAQTRTLKLESGDNSISKLELSGLIYKTGTPQLHLNLTIGADFGDNLHTIIGSNAKDDQRYANLKLNLNAEKGGTGGGSFYTTLNGLANKEQFAGIIDDLAGYQLSVQDTGLTILNAHVQGNTTINAAQNLSFEHSSIDNLVTFTRNYISSVNIKAGDSANPWIFSPTGDKTATLYGSATTDSELKAVFSGLNASNNAQDLFAQVLDKMSNGASKSNLAEVSMVKLDKAVYVIVDNNHNQSFDADDIVFSLGDRDPYLSAVSLHYQAPTIEANGVATASHTGEVIAA